MTISSTQSRPQPDSGPIDPVRVDLVCSADPTIVFASLAERCVPAVCDACTIDLEADGAHHRVGSPAPAADGATAPGPDEHAMHLAVGDAAGTAYRGVATFVWRGGPPTQADRLAAALMVDHAVRTVAWQRSEQRTREVSVRVENLERALVSSRRIGVAVGIVMSMQRITEAQAFATLQRASQHTNRKLRELALDVIDTGWLDPALMARPDPSRL